MHFCGVCLDLTSYLDPRIERLAILGKSSLCVGMFRKERAEFDVRTRDRMAVVDFIEGRSQKTARTKELQFNIREIRYSSRTCGTLARIRNNKSRCRRQQWGNLECILQNASLHPADLLVLHVFLVNVKGGDSCE